MTSWAWGAVCLMGVFLFAALGDLISEEIRGWLDLTPHAILRLAATQLHPELRASIYQQEWLPELTYVLRGAESRPITRVVRGVTFAAGLLLAARRISGELSPGRSKLPKLGRTVMGNIYRIHQLNLDDEQRTDFVFVVDFMSDRLGVPGETLLRNPRFVDALEATAHGRFHPRAEPGTMQSLSNFRPWPARHVKK